LSCASFLQRQNLTPLEEAAALTRLIHKGATLDDVAAQTGLSQTTIKRRLALNGLCEETSAALALGIISLSQAEALTLGGDVAGTGPGQSAQGPQRH
jgi:ParB-like chromosome segregation protein Spo0J